MRHPCIVSAMSLTAEVVATGCGDKLVRLFAIDGGLLLRTLVGHGGPVFAICIRDGVIVSGARDNTVRVWDLSDYARAPLEVTTPAKFGDKSLVRYRPSGPAPAALERIHVRGSARVAVVGGERNPPPPGIVAVSK